MLAALQQHLLLMEENQRQMRAELAALTAANVQHNANNEIGLAAQQNPPGQATPLPLAPQPNPTPPPFQHYTTPDPFNPAHQQVRPNHAAAAAQALASEITNGAIPLTSPLCRYNANFDHSSSVLLAHFSCHNQASQCLGNLSVMN